MLAAIDRFAPLKTSQSDEETGVDDILHGETAYL
jgi:ammonia channel protein AmtB